MWDFTREISLTPRDQKIYRILQMIFYALAVILSLYLAFLIIFPNRNFLFVLADPDSNKNNLANVKLENDAYPENGFIASGNSLRFNADLTDNYSSLEAGFILEEDSGMPVNPLISIRRSYQAFMYPEGEAIGFKDGTLLLEETNYYIVSRGYLRKFASSEVMASLGYSPSNFKVVSKEELKYNPMGEKLLTPDYYPDGALFMIENDYYILADQTLKKFSGEIPFLTQYEKNQAIKKEADFMKRYPISDEAVGFADGALVSNAESVFIISEGNLFPIDSVETFETKGFNWNDIVSAGSDELSLYEKAKLFNIRGVHPDGTVFKTIEDSKFYLIRDGKKHLLPSENIALSWSKRHPIAVSQKALDEKLNCPLKSSFMDSRSFSCTIPLSELDGLPGRNYEFELDSQNDIRLNTITARFEKKISKANLKIFLLKHYQTILTRYGKIALQ